MTAPVSGKQIGRSLPRLEARAKVSGRAEYTHTMRLPGMLVAKIFRSTVPHGRIKSVDVSEARKIPGVFGVYTGEDVRTVIPEPYYGPAFHDQPILALGKVHYVGEPVAAVLAADPHIAEQAVQLIAADYEELPAVFDEVEAAADQVLVHEELKPASTFADLKHLKGRKGTNCALDFKLRRGDVDKAFAAAAQVFEHTFRTQKVLHLALEPHASIADYSDDGVTIYTASQGPSFVRSEIARLLGWPENRVRVKVPYLGAGYGAKLYIKLEALAVALSMLARRPVKVALTMDEEFVTITKHPSTFRIKSGVDQNGKILARQCEVWWNGGAYADIGPRVTQKSGFTASGPYDIDNVAIDSYALYTNLPPAGALRGFGIPQLVWAYESHTDMIARALGRDPLEFRRKNILRDGRPHATGTILKDAAIDKVLDAHCRAAGLGPAVRPRQRHAETRARPRHRAQGGDLADHVGRHRQRLGRRQRHALLRHRRHGPGLRHRHGADRRRSAQHAGRDHPHRAARHRRDALRHGHARLALAVPHGARGAARGGGRAQAKIEALAREVGEPEGSQHSARRAVPEAIRHAGRQHHRHRHLQAGLHARPIRHRPEPNVTPFWMVAGTGAEVEVDTETGHVGSSARSTSWTAASRSIRRSSRRRFPAPRSCTSASRMFEKMHIDGGQVTNASLADYKIPGIHDVPAAMENE